ncbi:hypothetical protein HU200_003372 [Digitaria exilis]|uniref:Uncharacterized protein n=1 Tax=Digitaria exilis TaxID=1010633 RepID=A0A835KT97_9POAL|nr:hypothetical protein HU200_003372 [Digitaria exilis]
MASCTRSLALLLAVLAAASTAADSAGGVEGCGFSGKVRKITVQNLCNHDLPLVVTPHAGSGRLFGEGFVLPRGRHQSFLVCSWAGQLAAAASPPVELRLGVDGGAWYSADFTQLVPVHVTVTPHTDGGRLEGQCPVVGCEAGHGRCSRHIAAGNDCRNVDELKIIFFSA